MDESDEINIDFLSETDDLQNYLQLLDHDISTEECLTDEQIINLLQDEGNESENESDSDEEAIIVLDNEGIDAFKTIINYCLYNNYWSYSGVFNLLYFNKVFR